MFIVKHRKIFFAISAFFVILALITIFTKGVKFGIDFTGGTALEITYSEGERPALSEIREALSVAGFEDVSIRPFGEKGFMLEMQSTATSTHQMVYEAFASKSPTVVVSPANFIGPSIGAELRSKAWIAISVVIGAIVLFIAFAFRHATGKLSSWSYGFIAVIALIHDVIIPTGVASLLGIEVGSLFIIALLSILGLSMSDTIVVFDRVRENSQLKKNGSFEMIVGKSLNQTFVRSINTSATVVFVLLTLYFFGPASTKDFALILSVGMFFGTYSSIFLASPLLVEAEKYSKNEEEVPEAPTKKKKK